MAKACLIGCMLKASFLAARRHSSGDDYHGALTILCLIDSTGTRRARGGFDETGHADRLGKNSFYSVSFRELIQQQGPATATARPYSVGYLARDEEAASLLC